MQEVSVGDEQWHLFRWGHGRGGAIRKSSIKSCRLWSAFGLNGHGSHFRDFRRGPAWCVGGTKMGTQFSFSHNCVGGPCGCDSLKLFKVCARTYEDIGEHLNWKKLEGWKTGIAGIALQRWAGNTCTTEACRVPTTQPWDRAWKCTGNHMDVRLTPEVA